MKTINREELMPCAYVITPSDRVNRPIFLR